MSATTSVGSVGCVGAVLGAVVGVLEGVVVGVVEVDEVGIVEVGPASPSSALADSPSCKPPQLALFSPRWPNMVWERRVSEKRAHSANRGSTTYVMKPETHAYAHRQKYTCTHTHTHTPHIRMHTHTHTNR